MKILIDENLPHYLKKMLPNYDVYTVQDMGWKGVQNGALLRLAEADFDLFLTADKNIRHQQNLAERKLSFIVFPTNKLSVVKSLEEKLRSQIAHIGISDYNEL